MMSPRTSKTAARKQERLVNGGRQRLLDAALELFAERGYDGASVRDITEQAGVSVGLVNKHFGSKEGLRRAVDEWVFVISRPVWQHIFRSDPLEYLRSYDTSTLLAESDIDPKLYELSFAYQRRALLEGGPGSLRLFEMGLGLRRELVNTWKSAGKLRPEVDEQALVEILVSMAVGGVALMPLFRAHDPLGFDEEAFMKRRARLLAEFLEGSVF